MVVQCKECQTRFRIADEKVTERGVRVRCTSCKNVFQVKKGKGAAAGKVAGAAFTSEEFAPGPAGEAKRKSPADDEHDPFGMAELTGEAMPAKPRSSSSPRNESSPAPAAAASADSLELDLDRARPPPPSRPSEQSATPPAMAEADALSKAEAPRSKPPNPSRREAGKASGAGDFAGGIAERVPPGGNPLVASVLSGVVAGMLAIGVLALNSFIRPQTRGLQSKVLASHLSTGLYETSSGHPLFFVRGQIENHDTKRRGPIRVVAELVADGNANVRAEALAGAAPSPEDVFAIQAPGDVEKLSNSLRPSEKDVHIEPGASVPFVALFAEVPGELRRHQVRIRVEPDDPAQARTAEGPR